MALHPALGMGLGWHYLKASASWRAKVGATDRQDSANRHFVEEARWNGDDFALYSFTEKDNGAYAALDLAILYRSFEGRLGLGVMAQNRALMHGATHPDVSIIQDYGLDHNAEYGDLDGYEAAPGDYKQTARPNRTSK